MTYRRRRRRQGACARRSVHSGLICIGKYHNITSQCLGKYGWWNDEEWKLEQKERQGEPVGLGTRLHSMTLSLWWECLSSSAGFDTSAVSPRALFSICMSETDRINHSCSTTGKRQHKGKSQVELLLKCWGHSQDRAPRDGERVSQTSRAAPARPVCSSDCVWITGPRFPQPAWSKIREGSESYLRISPAVFYITPMKTHEESQRIFSMFKMSSLALKSFWSFYCLFFTQLPTSCSCSSSVFQTMSQSCGAALHRSAPLPLGCVCPLSGCAHVGGTGAARLAECGTGHAVLPHYHSGGKRQPVSHQIRFHVQRMQNFILHLLWLLQ